MGPPCDLSVHDIIGLHRLSIYPMKYTYEINIGTPQCIEYMLQHPMKYTYEINIGTPQCIEYMLQLRPKAVPNMNRIHEILCAIEW